MADLSVNRNDREAYIPQDGTSDRQPPPGQLGERSARSAEPPPGGRPSGSPTSTSLDGPSPKSRAVRARFSFPTKEVERSVEAALRALARVGSYFGGKITEPQLGRVKAVNAACKKICRLLPDQEEREFAVRKVYRNWSMGSFPKPLCEGIETLADASRDGKIRATELSSEAVDVVNYIARMIHAPPIPVPYLPLPQSSSASVRITLATLQNLGDYPKLPDDFYPWSFREPTRKQLEDTLRAVDQDLGVKDLSELLAIMIGAQVAFTWKNYDRFSYVAREIIRHVRKTIDDAIVRQLPTLLVKQTRFGGYVRSMCYTASCYRGFSNCWHFVHEELDFLLEQIAPLLLKCGYCDSEPEKWQMLKHLIARTMLCEEDEKVHINKKMLKSFLRVAETSVLRGLLEDKSLVPIAKRLHQCDCLARTRDIGDCRRGSLKLFHDLIEKELETRSREQDL